MLYQSAIQLVDFRVAKPSEQLSCQRNVACDCVINLPLLEFQRTQKFRKRFITGVQGKITHAQAATGSK